MATIKKAVVEIKDKVLSFQTPTMLHIIEADMLDESIVTHALMHGLKQKIADSYAGLKTDHEIDAAIAQVITTLNAGTWNAGRSSLGGIWVEAIARAAGVTIEEAVEKWNEMDEELQKEVKKNPTLKQAKAEIELERAQAKAKGTTLDLDSL